MRSNLLLVVSTTLVVWAPGVPLANDGAAEVGVGGIQLRSERRVAMRKERLFISLDKVKVEYDFVNESKEDVVTEVAFPIPEYKYSVATRWGADFGDFAAWVGDQRIPVSREVKAFRDGEDVTSLLESMGLDVRSMARVDESLWQIEPDGRPSEAAASLAQIPKLPREKVELLRRQRLIGWGTEGDARFWPTWSVRITYYWVQHFPPGQVVRIRHEYSPTSGIKLGISPQHLAEACAEPPLLRALGGELHESGRTGSHSKWVEYILTTANTWKTPIRDFELVLEYPEGEYVSLCWDGKIERSGPRTFRSVLKDFVPKRELRVYFFAPLSLQQPTKR
jgi:Domain of unknown function (DUF4424)